MIVWSSAGQSPIGMTMTGAASITVPGAMASRAKTPRPRAWLTRISMRWFGIGLILFFHTRLEGLDAFGEITHHSGQLSGAEQDQDNGQDHDPMHQAERTHNDDPGLLIDAYHSRSFCHLHRLVTRSSDSPEDSSPASGGTIDELFSAAASDRLGDHRPRSGRTRCRGYRRRRSTRSRMRNAMEA